jgi:integrase
MAEAGIPMPEISQFLGHANTRVTEEVYARFSPNYLRDAASALEYSDLGSANQRTTTQTGAK